MTKAAEFVLFTGCMYSGKSSRMLLEAQNHIHAERRVLAYKAKIDDRYSKTDITTHSGMMKLAAVPIETGKDLIADLVQYTDLEARRTTIVVDEVFMISGLANELIWLYRNGFSVLAASLDLGYSLDPFPEVAQILPWATRVEKCTAVCSTCRGTARYTWRKPEAGDDFILVGGVDLYEARCANCHPLMSKAG